MNYESQDKKEFVIEPSGNLQTERQLQSQLVESGGDFVLPDYMPKIQKVLRLEARALPPSRYVGANNVQMSGSVLHTLIYLGEDGETGATVLPSKYEFTVATDGFSSPSVTANVCVDSLNYRITAPRKLNIKTRLGTKPRCYDEEDITPTVTPVDAENISKLYGEIDTLKTQLLRTQDVQVSDVMQIGESEDVRLLWCGSTAAVTDARVLDGGVSVRGEVVCKLLTDSDGGMEMHTKKIPFDEFIVGEVSRGSVSCATADVVSTEASKGNSGEADIDVVIAIDAVCDTQIKLPVLKDAFSTEYNEKTEEREVKSSRLALSHCGVHTVSESIAKNSAGIGDGHTVIDTSGKAVIEETDISSGKLTVSGRCELCSVLAEDGAKTSAEYSVPFSITLDTDAAEDADIFAHAFLLNPKIHLEDDKLVCDMDISLAVRAVENHSESVISSIDCTSKEKLKKSTYPLCLIYPNGESLWSLAKKYRVCPRSLAKVNTLDITEKDYRDEAALSGIKSLMLELK